MSAHLPITSAATALISAAVMASAAAGQDRKEGDFDFWVRAAPRLGRAPAVDLFLNGNPKLRVVRVLCARKGELRFEFAAEGADMDPEYAADQGLELHFFSYRAPEEEAGIHMPAVARGKIVVSRLRLTPAVIQRIEAADHIHFYGENGPTNIYSGGRAIALRRLVRDCAA